MPNFYYLMRSKKFSSQDYKLCQLLFSKVTVLRFTISNTAIIQIKKRMYFQFFYSKEADFLKLFSSSRIAGLMVVQIEKDSK